MTPARSDIHPFSYWFPPLRDIFGRQLFCLWEAPVSNCTSICLRILLIFPSLVLKGIHHCWKLLHFSRGLKQMEGNKSFRLLVKCTCFFLPGPAARVASVEADTRTGLSTWELLRGLPSSKYLQRKQGNTPILGAVGSNLGTWTLNPQYP